MTEVRPGDTVRIHYTGRLSDGTEFDSSTEGAPLEFKVGAGQIIEGLDRAVTGMKVGDTGVVTVPSEQAYGPRYAEAVRTIPRETIPEHIELAPGLRLQAKRPDGAPIALTVIEVGETEVTVDANHPLAGQDLTFELEIVEVV